MPAEEQILVIPFIYQQVCPLPNLYMPFQMEDFAVKKDSGGNGGPYYDFYLQNKEGKFIKSNYLSKEMEYFPSKVTKRNLSLATYAHAGACWLGENIYHYNAGTHKWKKVRHRIIDVCK